MYAFKIKVKSKSNFQHQKQYQTEYETYFMKIMFFMKIGGLRNRMITLWLDLFIYLFTV